MATEKETRMSNERLADQLERDYDHPRVADIGVFNITGSMLYRIIAALRAAPQESRKGTDDLAATTPAVAALAEKERSK